MFLKKSHIQQFITINNQTLLISSTTKELLLKKTTHILTLMLENSLKTSCLLDPCHECLPSNDSKMLVALYVFLITQHRYVNLVHHVLWDTTQYVLEEDSSDLRKPNVILFQNLSIHTFRYLQTLISTMFKCNNQMEFIKIKTLTTWFLGNPTSNSLLN